MGPSVATLAWVAAGGAIGSVARFLMQTAATRFVPTFPLGTALVNILGSLVIGMLLPVVDKWSGWARPFLVVGVLGGLTTMSSFAAEVSLLIAEKRYLAAGLHWSGGAVICIAACMLGLALMSAANS